MKHPFWLAVIIAILYLAVWQIVLEMMKEEKAIFRLLGYFIGVGVTVGVFVLVLYCYFNINLLKIL